ncbi:ubiquitin carboxyl-terminal hydrolase L3 [Microdochium nivale]|nr:ubiquitin carboxyl-terminal hydrolase L3 [Microdochium nivale]
MAETRHSNTGKSWTMLENNPEVMNKLAYRLGLSTQLAFYDVWSLDDPQLLSLIPRPALALLVIMPHTPAWAEDRKADADKRQEYQGSGPDEPVVWFKQTIGNACGSIGLLHCAINGPASDFVLPGSALDRIRRDAIPLKMEARAAMLYDSVDFEEAHHACTSIGDTLPNNADHMGQHFVSFVVANGRLWELEGDVKGPLDRGPVEDGEDVLSPRVLQLGFQRVINLENDSGNDLRFSCLALARKD